jgi:hypothetical protein
MSALAHVEGLHEFQHRAPNPRPAPVPATRLNLLIERDIPGVERRTASTSSAASTGFSCGPGNTTSFCQKPVDGTSNTTIPIVLGILLPLTVAFVIFAVLHRRHVKKLRQEDANDAHKSLDFGIMEFEGKDGKKGKGKGRGKKGGPEMSMTETKDKVRRNRGMSMDLGEGNPYLLPPELQQSRDSLHSLSRAAASEDDRYARATSYVPNDGTGSYPSSLRRGPDDASSFTGSSRRTGFTDADSSHHLMRQARRMSSSGASATSPPDPTQEQSQKGPPKPFTPPVRNGSLAPAAPEPVRESFVSTASSNGAHAALRASHNYLGAFIRGGSPPTDQQRQKSATPTGATGSAKTAEPDDAPNNEGPPPQPERADPSPAPDQSPHTRHDEQAHPLPTDNTLHADNANVNLSASGPQPGRRRSYTLPEISIDDGSHLSYQQPALPELDLPAEEVFEHGSGYDYRRSTASIRPLPPDDPSDNPEQRANRIRSFYKEYFEETKPGPQANHQSYYDGSEEFADYHYAPDQAYETAYDEFYDPAYDHAYDQAYDQYYDDGYYYDQYPMEDDYSRSMTPQPRPRPRFMGPAHKPRSMSSGSYIPERSQVYSSASGRTGSAMGGMPAKKRNLPPPKPLHVLPTPHKMKDLPIDLLPIDFAPPSRSREQRAGTPDSMRGGGSGGLRPYSPAVPAHNPLASSFEELATMPSP